MFSIPPCWPSGPDMPAARMRPTVSDALPAANGTTMLSGRDGQSSARAVSDEAANAQAAANVMPRRRAGIIQFPDRSVRPTDGRLLNQGEKSKNYAREPRLDVEPQDVVLGQAESADGDPITDACVRPMPVVSMQPGHQLGSSLS